MASPVDFYFDFSSPYGYLGAELIEGVAERQNREVTWRPYLMGVLFKKLGTQPLVFDPVKGAYARRDIVRTAAYLDIPFATPDPFPVASIAACRAFYWLSDNDPALAKSFALTLMRGFYRENRNLSKSEVVVAAAAEVGIDQAEITAALKDAAVKERLRLEVNAALDRGVFGSPYFVVDDETFWGTDRIEQLEKWLATGGW